MNASDSDFRCVSLGWARSFALSCAVLFIACGLQAQFSAKPFAAEMIKTVRNKTTMAKVNVTATAMRSEGVQDGHKYISIVRYDRKIMWSLMPDTRVYFEMPIPADKWQGRIPTTANAAKESFAYLLSESADGTVNGTAAYP